MKNSLLTRLGVAALLSGGLLLAGCVNRPPALYGWGSYQAQVYEHFKGQGKGPEEQILALEQDLEQIRADGSALPPGYHAHLGLLYMSVGKNDRATQELLAEKTLFPESASYIDRLLGQIKKAGG